MKIKNNFLYLFLLLVSFTSNSNAQDSEKIKHLGPKDVIVSGAKTSNGLDSLNINNIRLFTIGIGQFFKPYGKINAPAVVNRYEDVAKFLEKAFHKKIIHTPLSKSEVTTREITDGFTSLMYTVKERDLVIISITSHGDTIKQTREYVLVCSDGTIQGSQLNYYIEEIAKKGAYVFVFVDTCHGEALFDNISKNNNSSELENIGGFVVYYASSMRKGYSKQIEYDLAFTQRIINIFSGKVDDSFSRDDNWTNINKIEACVNTAFTGEKIEKKYPQHPNMKIFPEGKADNIRMTHLFKRIDSEKNPCYLYLGVAGGLNINPTPNANLNIGVDINQRHKIELGASFAFTQSDDVFIYDKNGILQNGYKYRGWNIYGRYGCNIKSKESRWEIVPLGGFSGNFVSGKKLDGYNSDTGETASSFMFSTSCRFACNIYKDKRLLFHGTLGCDFPINIKKDGNVDILKEDKYIKNWCSIRPYVEIGIIARLFYF